MFETAVCKVVQNPQNINEGNTGENHIDEN